METNQNPTDSELLDRFYAGDEMGYQALYLRYRRPLALWARRILGNRDEVEDVAQDALLKLYDTNKKHLEREKNVRSWLYRVCANACYSVRRETKFWAEIPDLDTVPFSGSVAFTLAFRRVRERFPDCLRKLDADERMAITLRHLFPKDLTNIELAAILEKSEGEASKITSRAEKKLKHCLELPTEPPVRRHWQRAGRSSHNPKEAHNAQPE